MQVGFTCDLSRSTRVIQSCLKVLRAPNPKNLKPPLKAASSALHGSRPSLQKRLIQSGTILIKGTTISVV